MNFPSTTAEIVVNTCLLTNTSKTFLVYCSGKVTMIIMPSLMHYFIIFSRITKKLDFLAKK